MSLTTLIILWAASYLILSSLSLFIIANKTGELCVFDLAIVLGLGLVPAVPVLVFLVTAEVYGSGVVVWRKK